MAVAEQETASKWADSKTAWKRRVGHNITLETGMKVRVKFPDSSALLRNGDLPRELVHVAFMDKFAPGEVQKIVGDQDKEAELLRQFTELNELLLLDMVIEPTLTLEELRSLPQEDLELLQQIAMRERNTDAAGVVLGVVPLDLFTTFREAHDGQDIPEGHPPFPDPDCEFCVEGIRAFSSLREVLL